MEYDIETDEFGTFYYKKGTNFYHREGGPAIEWADCGDKEWFVNDEYHREDGPAIEYVNGDYEYFINGELHREDGPAISYNGDKSWYINGKKHREGGPAVELANGNKMWWANGDLHRIDGPAVELCKAYMEVTGLNHQWYINGQRLSPEKEQLMNMWWNNKNGI